MVSPSLYWEQKDDSKALETLIDEEGRDLNLCTASSLFTVLCLVTSPKWPSPRQHLLSLAGDGIAGGGLGHFESYSVFMGLSHLYRRYTCYKTSVCFSPINLSFITRCGEVSQSRTCKGRRKIIFPPLRQAWSPFFFFFFQIEV